MKIAETVTFGGSALDRLAQDRLALDPVKADPQARAILLWRGKPMVLDGQVVRVPLDHPALDDANPNMIFLGRDAGAPTFGADLSAWTPDDLDDATLNTFLDATLQRHPAFSQDHVFAELRAIMTELTPRDAELAITAKAMLHWHRSHRFCAACGHESTFAMGGWQRDCPQCSAQHYPRTDPVVIMLIVKGNSVLLGRSPGWPEGMYSLLAGFVEPGETLEAAVRREVLEETNIQVGAVSYLASQPWPFPASLMFGCYGEATSTDITIDPTEIEDALWVTKEELALAFSGQHPKILPARKGAIAHYLLENWLADRLD